MNFQAVLVLTLVGSIICEPKVPSQYPIFYLSPHFGPHQSEKIAIIPKDEDPRAPPMITNRMSIAADPENPDENPEVTQFHSQDAVGRFIYGFHAPDQVRMESRDHDGTVRGSYSYVDPYGNIVKMQYWDDGNGFHTAGNNVPRIGIEEPQYTPEVQAARDEHFRLYKQALAVASALSNSANKHEYPFIQPELDQGTYDEQNDGDSVIIGGGENVEDDDTNTADFNNYPSFSQEIMSPNHVLDDERESISIDNPELSFRNAPSENLWFRKKKSYNHDKGTGQKPEEKVEDDIEKIEMILKGQLLDQYYKTPDEQDDTDGLKRYLLVADESPSKNDENKKTDFKNSVNEAPSISYLARKAGSIPVAAVHDVQVSPFQRGNIPNHQILPVFTGHLVNE